MPAPNRLLKLLLLTCGFVLASCATQQYGYAPVTHHPNSFRADGEAFYPAPGQGSSNIRVRSMGIVEIQPRKDAPEILALDVRISLSNQGGSTWLFDAEDQYISFPNAKPVAPSFVNSDSSQLPKLEVPPKHLRIVDLFFELPKSEPEAKDIPEFDFSWKLMAGSTELKDTTVFDRIPIPEGALVLYPYAPYSYPPGWGPYWWVWGSV